MRWGEASIRPDALRWCARCIPFSRPSPGDRGDGGRAIQCGRNRIGLDHLRPPIHGAGENRGAAVRRLRPALERAYVVLDAARRRDIILTTPKPRDGPRAGTGRGRRTARGSRRARRMAVALMARSMSLFVDPPEVIRATIRSIKMFRLEAPRRHAFEPLYPCRQHRGERPRQDHHRRQSAGYRRAAVGRQVFLRDRSEDEAEDRLPKLDKIVFHEKLGTQGERVQRIAALAKELAPLVGADEAWPSAPRIWPRRSRYRNGRRVSGIAGADGRYYATAQGEYLSVAAACRSITSRRGQATGFERSVSIAVALADKIDTLVGFGRSTRSLPEQGPLCAKTRGVGVIRLILETGYG